MDKTSPTSSKPKLVSKTQKAFVACTEMAAQMEQYAKRGESDLIVEQVVAHFKIAKKYLFNKLAGEFASFLQHYYYVVDEKEKLAVKYTQLALYYNELAYYEKLVRLKFSSISFQLNRTKNPDTALIADLKQLCNELKTYLIHDSSEIWIRAYLLFNTLSSYEGNPNQIIKQCNEVIQYLNEKGVERSFPFYKDLAVAYIRKGEYDTAVIEIDKAISSIKKGTSSWSVFVYYRVIIELHRGDYQKAYDIYKEAESKRYIKKSLNKVVYETWYFVKGYIKFLILAGKIESDSHQFKIGHFLNSIIIFNKDKSGHKINTLILKIILRLDSEKGRELIMKERDAIKKYSEENFENGSRARVLFRRLLHIVPGDFNSEYVVQRVEKNVDPLEDLPGYDPDLEIIPYGDLWGMVLGVLD